MNKEAAGLGRVLVIAGFALSCFGLLVFLWLAFGGSVPFKPKGYRVQAAFADAATLAEQADVRVAGVPVGKVVKKELAPEGNATVATMELESRYAPLRTDARAILRQKTLLGETYVELTTGTKKAPVLQDGAQLRNAAVQPAVEFDELLRLLDPDTRVAFQQWQQTLAEATGGQGDDLNDALGSLEPFVADAQDVVDVLSARRRELKGLIRGTGDTFEAITRNEGALQALIRDQRSVFGELSDRREALADTFQVLPTFQRESRATIRRVTRFSRDTEPLLRDLEPVLEDAQPTLASLRQASPSLTALFGDLRPLIRAGRTGFPALADVLRGLDPTLAAFGPFLQQVNPILQFLELYQATVADFLNTGPSALKIRIPPPPEQTKTNGHALPQIVVTGSQSFPADRRTRDNRGNAYFAPDALNEGLKDPKKFVLPVWDCGNAGGPSGKEPDKTRTPPDQNATPGCFVQGPVPFQGDRRRFPNVEPSGPGGTPQSDEQRR